MNKSLIKGSVASVFIGLMMMTSPVAFSAQAQEYGICKTAGLTLGNGLLLCHTYVYLLKCGTEDQAASDKVCSGVLKLYKKQTDIPMPTIAQEVPCNVEFQTAYLNLKSTAIGFQVGTDGFSLTGVSSCKMSEPFGRNTWYVLANDGILYQQFLAGLVSDVVTTPYGVPNNAETCSAWIAENCLAPVAP